MFSFKINKKSGSTTNPVQKISQQLPKSKKAFNDDDDAEDDEPDFIDGLDGNKIVSKKKEKKVEKKELVIPLISKNEWRIDKDADEKRKKKDKEGSLALDIKTEPESESDSKSQAVSEEDSLKQQAIRELLEGQSSKESEKDANRAIPILFQNRVPDGYEEDDNMDVSLRPDQSTLDDYERIPIEDFGLALLRGMGWKETEGIGLKNKKVVNMAEPKLRPKGMGLGAEAAHMNKNMAPANAAQGKEEKEDLSLKIGGYGIITRGSKKGYYGQIESFDEDNNRVILRLAISGKMEAVSKFYINVVSAKEYKKSSKVINSEKYEEYKIKQESKHQNDGGNESEHRESSGRRRSRSESDDEDPRDSRTRSRRESDDEEPRDSRSRSRRDDREDDYRGKKERKSSRKDRDRSRDRYEDKHERHSSRRYDDKRNDESRSSRHRYDDYESSSKYDDRDKKIDYRHKNKNDRGYDRR